MNKADTVMYKRLKKFNWTNVYSQTGSPTDEYRKSYYYYVSSDQSLYIKNTIIGTPKGTSRMYELFRCVPNIPIVGVDDPANQLSSRFDDGYRGIKKIIESLK